MLTTHPIKNSTPRQVNIEMSDTANQLIGNKRNDLLESIDLLLNHECYNDATMLITQNLPLHNAIKWSEWSISTFAGLTPDLADFEATLQSENMSNELLKDQDSNSPSVWFTAANFWNQQYKVNPESFLENLVREAVYSSITLVVRNNHNDLKTHQTILEKGRALLDK